MPFWKIMIVGLSACVCMALAAATFAAPFTWVGSVRWVWMGGLFVATLASGALFSFFMMYAGHGLDVKRQRTRM